MQRLGSQQGIPVAQRQIGVPSTRLSVGGEVVPWHEVATPTVAHRFAGAESQEASYVNLANPIVSSTPQGSPQWNATDGLIFDGLDDYLETGFNVPDSQDYTVVLRYTEYLGRGFFWLLTNGTQRHGYRPDGGVFAQGGVVSVLGSNYNGVAAISNGYGWQGGVKVTGQLAYTAGYDPPLLELGHETGGANLIRGNVQDFAIYQPAISDSDLALICTLMAQGI